MSVDRKILFELVKEEADNLKKFATRIELDRLNFYEVTPHKRNKCIYGQMTGDCICDRAEELIFKCCSNTYSSNNDNIENATLIGPPKENRFFLNFQFMSPIEMFLYVAEYSQIKMLVLYLQGKTQWSI